MKTQDLLQRFPGGGQRGIGDGAAQPTGGWLEGLAGDAALGNLLFELVELGIQARPGDVR